MIFSGILSGDNLFYFKISYYTYAQIGIATFLLLYINYLENLENIKHFAGISPVSPLVKIAL